MIDTVECTCYDSEQPSPDDCPACDSGEPTKVLVVHPDDADAPIMGSGRCPRGQALLVPHAEWVQSWEGA